MSAEDRGLRLRWSVDADQGARQSSSASHRDIDRGRQPIDIVILGADHDPGMSREAGVQTDELPPVQGEHGPAGVRSELQDGMVRDSLVGLARLEGRQPIVSQLSEGVDDLEGEVLVRVERGPAYAASFCLIASSISCRCVSAYAHAWTRSAARRVG